MFGSNYISLPFVFQTFGIFQQCSQILCLTIDNHLKPAVHDCYTRISIGSKLPDVDIALRTNMTSLTECEEHCSKNGNSCNTFSFGVGAKGNSTCLISLRIPSLENLETDPEYDVYAKRQNSLWCHSDRTYESFTRENRSEVRLAKVKTINKNGPTLNIVNPFSKPASESVPVLKTLSTLSLTRNDGHTGIYDLFTNRDKHYHSDYDNYKVLDTVANKNEKTSFSPFVATCHRKLQPGKRMMGMFIERVVNCENLQDCCRACDYEKTFVCKGFNHRGRVDGSKCTCELTSTPHFRMDADEDFLTDSHCDYYEKTDDCSSSTWRDRNNIPYWREPIKSYKQNDQNRWSNGEAVDKDFVREPPIYRDGSDSPYRESAHHFFNGPARSNEQFHYEEPHGFTSRYNALNWNRNWKGPESDITKDNILPNSRLNYNKEYLDVKSSIFSKSRPGDRSQTEDRLSVHPLSVSDKNDHLYGKFYNYGGAFGYNSYPSIPRESHYGKHETSQICRCSMKLVSGSKLSRRVIRKTCLAHDLEQCEEFCINETSFPCESFAYRYSVLTTNPTDNCLLSDHSYQHLNFYTDLEPNRDYDSYILTPDAKICYSRKSTGRQPSEECFSRIRSGFTMPVDITRRSMSVHDLGECQFACTASREFVCRSLVFRYGTDSHGRYSQDRESSNCFLTDWSSEEINPINMPDMDGAELYERNTVSYGCDTYPLQSSISNAITPNDKGPSPVHTDERCYSEYHRPCKLMSHAVVSSARASTKLDCRRKCSTMRNTGTVPCMSFNYIINNGNTEDNCFLSDISIRDLRPNLDYVHDNEHTLYTWKDFDPYCRLMANAYNTINSTPMFETYDQVHPSTLSYANGQGALGSRNHIFGSDFDSSVWWRNKFTPEGHEYDYKHEFTNQDSKVPVDSGTFEHGHNLFYSNQLSPSHHYTVNGYPCKNTTVCQQNEITGFWSCEIEDEYGSWDYCCKPSHQCGFSQGYHYPWCYVGSNENQWRPCSETYYPYYSAKDHSIYRQSPLYTARHWPVIYFHETSPLNCSANDPDHKNS